MRLKLSPSTIYTIFLVCIVCYLLYNVIVWISHQIEIDTCLDRGGAWNYELSGCETTLEYCGRYSDAEWKNDTSICEFK